MYCIRLPLIRLYHGIHKIILHSSKGHWKKVSLCFSFEHGEANSYLVLSAVVIAIHEDFQDREQM